MLHQQDLTQGNITSTLLRFTLPMLAGALLQQCYNITDTLIVGRYIGSEALAAVGSSYALMIFITSIIIGLTMGSGTVFALHYGAGKTTSLRRSVFSSFILTGGITVILNIVVCIGLTPILHLLQVPEEVFNLMHRYLQIIFTGIVFCFLYNFFAALLRAVGDSVTPLWFLMLSVIINIVLDLGFIVIGDYGISGAAWATVIAQGMAACGIGLYTYLYRPELYIHRQDCVLNRDCLKEITTFSSLTCIQQSVMNLGILMVQGLVNSFGTTVMAAFAAAVKIDSFAYMPVQEFGNAFSTFIAQNFGAQQKHRINQGMRQACWIATLFSIIVSVIVYSYAEPLMCIFVRAHETEILHTGVYYLQIEGACYVGIGLLFLLYGYYRGIRQPGMSVILTILSLGTRVALSYFLSSFPSIGVCGIWWSIPIGWALADAVGFACLARRNS